MDHDHSYKLLFTHPEMVADLLRGFVKEDWVKDLDFSTLEKANGSYVSDDLRDRYDDIVWRIRWKNENVQGKDQSSVWLYVYLLIEFQSSVDWFMAVRIMTYIGLLYQDLIRSEAVKTNELLPPVLPIVLYNGGPRWQASVDIADLIIPAPGELEHYRPHLRYLLLDEGRYQDHELASLRNLSAALFRLENSRTPEDVQQVLQTLIVWLQSPEQSNLRRAFTIWLKKVFLPGRMPEETFDEIQDLQEVHNMLSERVKEWSKNWEQQGIEKGWKEGWQKGMQKGWQEGELSLLLRLLEWRFGPVSEVINARVKQADSPTLELWSKRILTAQTIEEVFAG
ncbi:Rpn family recombination-promoting nuclease/putative transposase [Nitrosomonas sp.]|uniref:Rpn family recombination-promoting nuclease/putative transposase n=1 Tax=Nitrosomonas sp. TaxID=42353 RepID=UPI0025E9F5A8|nr:Rpn family recombination-promoting nuclease/putative transposase [Nitrosomonas sp.]